MKRVVVILLIVAVLIGNSAMATGYEHVDKMNDIETYCRGKLEALCVIYEVGGIDMFTDDYSELIYRYLKLYLAADNVKTIEMIKEVRNQGKELPEMDDRIEMEYYLESCVDNYWLGYVGGEMTKKDYLDWMVNSSKQVIGQ